MTLGFEMIWPFGKTKLTLGGLKRLEDMTLSDFETHPIWVTDLSGKDAAGFDETSQHPVVGCADVTKQMREQSVDVSVAIDVTDTDMCGSANTEQDLSLSCIAVWYGGGWKTPRGITTFPDDAEVRVMPTIKGEATKFRHVPGTDKARWPPTQDWST